MQIPKEPFSIVIGREALQIAKGNLKAALDNQDGLRTEVVLAYLDRYLRLLPEPFLAVSYVTQLGFMIDELDVPLGQSAKRRR